MFGSNVFPNSQILVPCQVAKGPCPMVRPFGHKPKGMVAQINPKCAKGARQGSAWNLAHVLLVLCELKSCQIPSVDFLWGMDFRKMKILLLFPKWSQKTSNRGAISNTLKLWRWFWEPIKTSGTRFTISDVCRPTSPDNWLCQKAIGGVEVDPTPEQGTFSKSLGICALNISVLKTVGKINPKAFSMILTRTSTLQSRINSFKASCKQANIVCYLSQHRPTNRSIIIM